MPGIQRGAWPEEVLKLQGHVAATNRAAVVGTTSMLEQARSYHSLYLVEGTDSQITAGLWAFIINDLKDKKGKSVLLRGLMLDKKLLLLDVCGIYKSEDSFFRHLEDYLDYQGANSGRKLVVVRNLKGQAKWAFSEDRSRRAMNVNSEGAVTYVGLFISLMNVSSQINSDQLASLVGSHVGEGSPTPQYVARATVLKTLVLVKRAVLIFTSLQDVHTWMQKGEKEPGSDIPTLTTFSGADGKEEHRWEMTCMVKPPWVTEWTDSAALLQPRIKLGEVEWDTRYLSGAQVKNAKSNTVKAVSFEVGLTRLLPIFDDTTSSEDSSSARATSVEPGAGQPDPAESEADAARHASRVRSPRGDKGTRSAGGGVWDSAGGM
jgi:hypothetical protein